MYDAPLGALFALAFAAAPSLKDLTLRCTVTRRLIMQKARGRTALRGAPCDAPSRHSASTALWTHGFRFYFTRLAAVLFIFHSRYSCTIGRQGILSLGRWASRIRTRFHVSGVTWEPVSEGAVYTYGPFTLCGPAFQPLSI